MDCITPGFPVPHQLPEFAQTHVHWVDDDIQPSHPLLSPSPPAFNLYQHQGLFQWVSSSHQVTKVLEFQLQHQSFQWIQDWFPLGLTGLISLLFKGLRSLLHITVQKHQFFYFDWDYLVLAARPLLMFSPFFRLLFPFFLFQLNPTILLLQEGGPLPGPKTGLLSNTPRRHMCWQSKRLYWERVPGWRAVG